MGIGDIVQIRIPKRWASADYYKFNCYVGEIVDLCEKCLAKIAGINGILWPIEWLIEQEEEDENIEAIDLDEL